jgi:carbohydrate binding protein with CBM4/9 domain
MRSALFLILAGTLWSAGAVYPNRWVLISRALSSDQDVEDIRNIAKTASEHGLTGIVLHAEFDLATLKGADYFGRLKKVREICRHYKLEIIPALFSVGWGSVVVHDRNLAEGLEVRDALFVARGGEARLVEDPPVAVVNRGFETFVGDRATGWTLQDEPGRVTFADNAAAADGSYSLRLEPGRSSNGLARVMQEVAVKPRRAYRVSLAVKSEDLPPGTFYLQVLAEGDRRLSPGAPSIAGTTDWHRITWGFNSLRYEKVRIYAGSWGARSGRFWVDDVRVEEIGPLNVLHRAGTPVTVRGEEGTTYREREDYEPVSDGPLFSLGYDHNPPAIQLRGKRIPDGQRLRVSYYQGVEVGGSQVSACMSEPKLYRIFAEQARAVQNALAPSKYLLSMDEVRVAASCDACRRRGISAAQILGDCMTREEAILRTVNPQAEIYVWSDMLDPNQNAVKDYYLVEGDFTGSWNYIPADLGIVCWYYDKRVESLAHFSGLGFRTAAGTYYDADDLENPKGWLQALANTPKACGVLYATFQNKYGLLGAWGDLVSAALPH